MDFKLISKHISLLIYFAPFLTKPNWILGINNYSPGVFICTDADPPHQHWIAYYWTCALVFDTTILFMAVHRAWAYRLYSNKHNLMRALAQDSILYFVV